MLYSIVTIIIFVLALSAGAFGGEHNIPYGDYSDWCGAYGTCKEDIGPKEAESAIVRYFGSKGYRVTNIQHKGRFVEADIQKNSSFADKVIFDRKTGRVRSTY